MSIAPRPIRLSPLGKLITVGILVALALLLVRAIGPAMSPFIAGAITAYLFNPLIHWLNQRTRIGRAAWILALYVLIGILVYALVRYVGPRFGMQFNDLRHQFPAIVKELQHQVTVNHVIEFGGVRFDLGPIEGQLTNLLTELSRTFPERVPHLFLTAIESLLLFLTYLIVTFYFLLQSEQLMNWLYNLVPAAYRDEVRGLGKQIDQILASYIRGTLLLIPVMSVVTYVMLTILGVRYALVLAIMTGFLEVIPLVGPWTAAGSAMLVALFQATTPFGWDNWVLAVVVVVGYFVLRMSEDNFIIPYVVGSAVHLHPVLVLFAILAGGALGGAFGLFIAIPTVAVVRLLLRYVYRKLIDSPELPPSDVTPPLAPALPRPKEITQLLTPVQSIEQQ